MWKSQLAGLQRTVSSNFKVITTSVIFGKVNAVMKHIMVFTGPARNSGFLLGKWAFSVSESLEIMLGNERTEIIHWLVRSGPPT